MKIAQIAPAIEQVPPPKYGGTELVISNITEELVRRGHEVHLFASGDSKTKAELHPVTEKAIRAAYSVEEYPAMRDVQMHLGMENILNSLCKEKFDVVHNHIGWRLLPFEGIIQSPVILAPIWPSLRGRYRLPLRGRPVNMAMPIRWLTPSAAFLRPTELWAMSRLRWVLLTTRPICAPTANTS